MMVIVKWDRTILHLDMDAFFAAIEQLDHPHLRGLPLLIGHDGPRGVVATASYEARPFGCHSAQPMAVARRLCPQAVVVPVRGQRYREVSRRMFEILEEFSPLVEPLSVDEAFLDLTGTERSLGDGRAVAKRLKERIRTELGLTGSVGLAPNKFLAKLASDMNKPDGLTIIAPEDIDRILSPLPVTRIWGIGPVTAGRLEQAGIGTIADLRRQPGEWFERFFGSDGTRYRELSRGIDRRPVVSDQQAKSISHEQTFGADVAEADEVRRVLLDQVEQVAFRLRRAGLEAAGVSLKIRYGRFETIHRSTTLDRPTTATGELWQAARRLFEKWSFKPVRLIGMAAERLTPAQERMSLFPDPVEQRQSRLDAVADQINEKFGKRAIRRGGG
jgi:DNA polymerase IV